MARKKKEKEVIEVVNLEEDAAPIVPEDAAPIVPEDAAPIVPEDAVPVTTELSVEEDTIETTKTQLINDINDSADGIPSVIDEDASTIEVKVPTSSFTELFVSTKSSSVTGYVDHEKFAPSISGWGTTDNDKKKRPSFGIHINTKIGVFGTLRVDEDGKVSFMKHTNFDKLVKDHKKEILTKGLIIDEFIAVKKDDKKVLETKKVFVKLA